MAQTRINISDIHLGMRFTAPVFFDDGKNMFLAEKKPVKQYHINALERWSIPFLLTYGTVIEEKDKSPDGDAKTEKSSGYSKTDIDESVLNDIDEFDDIEELDGLEELDVVDDIE